MHRQAKQQVVANFREGNSHAYEQMAMSLLLPDVTSASYVNSNGVGHFPVKPSLARSLSRMRSAFTPKPPTVLADLVNMPIDLRKRPCGDLFIQYIGPGDIDEGICVICFTDDSLRYLFESETLCADDTFGVVPSLYYKQYGAGCQLLLLSYVFNGKLLTGMYALLPSKSEQMYLFAFNYAKGYAINVLHMTLRTDITGMSDLSKHYGIP